MSSNTSRGGAGGGPRSVVTGAVTWPLDECDYLLGVATEVAGIVMRSPELWGPGDVARAVLNAVSRRLEPCRARLAAAEARVATLEGERVAPFLLPEDAKQVLRPRLEVLADKLCQTQGYIIGALADSGLTVVPLATPPIQEGDPR